MAKSALLSSICFSAGCGAIGSSPKEVQRTKFTKSKNFDSLKGKFQNEIPHIEKNREANNSKLELAGDYFFSKIETVPKRKLPEKKPDLEEFMSPSKYMKIIWLGHSSFLLRLDEVTVLVDPVFSNSASPVSFLIKRFQKPVLKVTDLPKIDLVVISHDHYDHLDRESILELKDRDLTFITPLGVGAHLVTWGVKPEKIIERDWWENYEAKGLTLTATPAQHFSGRGINDRNKTLWASWAIKSQNHNIYYSGDSGYANHFREIGEKLGPFDLAFIECGQYNKRWTQVHMLPEQSAEALSDLKAKHAIPVHWGMFELAMHHWAEPVERIYQATKDKGISLLTPQLGELVRLDGGFQSKKWWKNMEKDG
ncbi:MAG: MBL fold metallo-hydrolase [Oligoflexales bacterium]